MILKLGMQHRGLKLYKVCINGDWKSYDLKTWHAASGTRPLLSLYKWWPWVNLDLFYSKVKFGRLCIWMENFFTKKLNGKNFQQITKLTEDLYFWNTVLIHQGIVCPYPWAIYMYMTIIFKYIFPDNLETRHGPSVTLGLQSGYKWWPWFDHDLFYSKVKFCRNCSLCFRQIVRWEFTGPLVLWFLRSCNLFNFCQIWFVCNDVAICDLVHGVETVHYVYGRVHLWLQRLLASTERL